MQRVDQVTVEQARAIQSFSPASWTITSTPEGWVVRRGDAELIGTNTRRRRLFKTVDAAVRRLREEVGVREFRVIDETTT